MWASSFKHLPSYVTGLYHHVVLNAVMSVAASVVSIGLCVSADVYHNANATVSDNMQWQIYSGAELAPAPSLWADRHCHSTPDE